MHVHTHIRRKKRGYKSPAVLASQAAVTESSNPIKKMINILEGGEVNGMRLGWACMSHEHTEHAYQNTHTHTHTYTYQHTHPRACTHTQYAASWGLGVGSGG